MKFITSDVFDDDAESKKAETIPPGIGGGDRKSPRFLWGLGHGLPTTRGDLVLLRQAINEDWPITLNVRQAIVDELADEANSTDVRRGFSVLRTFLTIDRANLRLLGN